MAISDYKEAKGYPQFRYSADGQVYTRKFHGPWDDRFDFVNDQISRGFMTFPVIDAQIDPYNNTCAEVEVDFNTMIANGNSYKLAEITIQFGYTQQSARSGRGRTPTGATRPNSVTKSDQTILTYSATGSHQLVTIPGRGLKWQSGSQAPADFGDTVRTGLVSHEFSWLGIDIDQINLVEDLSGKCNDAELTLPITGRVIDIGCLMMEDFSITLTVDAGSVNTLKWESKMKMIERDISWQYFYNTASGDWERLEFSDSEPVIELAPFEGIFNDT